jgi:hypothetical protein
LHSCPQQAWTVIFLFILSMQLGWQVPATVLSFYCLNWDLEKFLPRLVWNLDPTELSFLSICNYRYEATMPSLKNNFLKDFFS